MPSGSQRRDRPERGIVLNAPNLKWDDLPAADEAARRLDMPVVLDNDVNAAVFAELHGRAWAAATCWIWIGTGVGAGSSCEARCTTALAEPRARSDTS